MKKLKETTIEEIEHYLVSLGRGNHEDNMERVREGEFFYEIELSELEFRSLTFCPIENTHPICPLRKDRRLIAVGKRAVAL